MSSGLFEAHAYPSGTCFSPLGEQHCWRTLSNTGDGPLEAAVAHIMPHNRFGVMARVVS